jgi:hypothetical protein
MGQTGAFECVQRALIERDEARHVRDEANCARDAAFQERDIANHERMEMRWQRDKAILEKTAAIIDRDVARRELECATTDLDAADKLCVEKQQLLDSALASVSLLKVDISRRQSSCQKLQDEKNSS